MLVVFVAVMMMVLVLYLTERCCTGTANTTEQVSVHRC